MFSNVRTKLKQYAKAVCNDPTVRYITIRVVIEIVKWYAKK